MKRWEKFSTFKERGEWVELLFMAAAAAHGYHVLKPRGDSLAYDVGIEHAAGLLRVQVKSSSVRDGTGYFCQFRRNYLTKDPYTVDDLDLFAAYLIPVTTWYLIPAAANRNVAHFPWRCKCSSRTRRTSSVRPRAARSGNRVTTISACGARTSESRNCATFTAIR